ncbi:hypothetical protein [Oryzicola mucosus]|uniref:Uncharacterized protein n=1 Tax=Oryzicola mucosus TaxID=2767425 RepID=A0A8J6PWU6_9HYPH|nr:hypothetical protein [Oryzicola mucosus]MBD0416446.1 hypothetical protein [Oryzicola mucosus]
MPQIVLSFLVAKKQYRPRRSEAKTAKILSLGFFQYCVPFAKEDQAFASNQETESSHPSYPNVNDRKGESHADKAVCSIAAAVSVWGERG